MALILSIETSATVCSVALHQSGQLLEAIEVNEPQAHAAKTAVLVRDILQQQKKDIKELSAVAVSSGPGSYTGLRIGTSTAKGICFALGIPLISVPTLELLANSVSEKDITLCPMIDARRMEVYCQLFSSEREPISETQAVVIDESSFHELLSQQPVLFFGDGSAKCKPVLNHVNARFADDVMATAKNMGEVAFKKFEQKKFEDLIAFTPFYLKEFQAKKAVPFF